MLFDVQKNRKKTDTIDLALKVLTTEDFQMSKTDANKWVRWQVTVACFLICLLILIPLRIYGILFVEVLDRYKTSRQLAGYPLFVSLLVRCSGGFGIALGTTLLVQILKKYFKDTASVYGATLAGGGISIMISSPLIIYLLNTFGVSGTFLIVSGIILHSIPISMILVLLRQKTIVIRSDDVTFEKTKHVDKANCNQKVDLESNITDVDMHQIDQSIHITEEMENKQVIQTLDKDHDQLVVKNPDSAAEYSTGENFTNHGTVNKRSGNKKTTNNELFSRNESSNSRDLASRHEDSLVEQNAKQTFELQRVDKLNKNAISDCRQLDNSESVIISTVDDKHVESHNMRKENIKQRSISNFSPDESQISESKPCFNPNTTRRFLNILLDPSCILIIITQSFYIYNAVIVGSTAIDYSIDKGIDRSKHVYLLMCPVIGELIGQLGFGWITDKHYVTRTTYCASSYILMSLANVFIASSKSFETMLCGIILLNLVQFSFLTVLPGIIFDHLEPDKHTMLLASRFFLYGPLSFTIAPLIGHFRVNLGSYDGIIYILAACYFVCGTLILLIPYFANRRRAKESTQS